MTLGSCGDIMVRAERGIRAPRPALTTGTMLEASHVMAARQFTTANPAVQSLPPEPYSDNPLSVLFVLFRPIEGWPEYGVDTEGGFWSRRVTLSGGPGQLSSGLGSWRRLLGHRDDGGHICVSLCRDGKRRQVFVHRLVLTAFVGSCPPGLECCHNDGNPANNRLRNLRWDTQFANAADAVRHGVTARGVRIGLSKLTEDQVREIRRRRSRGEKLIPLGVEFGVNHVTILRVSTGELWGHVT
jgi:hypothetical protein